MLEIQSRLGEWAYRELQRRNFVWRNPILQKLEDAYCAFLGKLYPRCMHKGCKNQGDPCVLRAGYGNNEKDKFWWYCFEHAQRHGFCKGCGEFWGGTESFDFGNGYCSNCQDEFAGDYYDEDAVGWEYEL